MVDKTIQDLSRYDEDISLIGKVVLLKSWATKYEPQKPWRHLIKLVVDEESNYLVLKPFAVNLRSMMVERLPRYSIEGIMSEEFAEQLLMMEILKT